MHRWILAFCLLAGVAVAQEPADEAQAAATDRTRTGDVLLIEKVERSRGIDVPRQGMRKAEVEARYGEPVSRSPAVGDPPITRWRYPEFTVYFEYELVIHSVVDREVVGLD